MPRIEASSHYQAVVDLAGKRMLITHADMCEAMKKTGIQYPEPTYLIKAAIREGHLERINNRGEVTDRRVKFVYKITPEGKDWLSKIDHGAHSEHHKI